MCAAASRQLISFGPFEFDTASGLLYRDQTETLLPFRVANLLDLFLRRPGEVLTKDELLTEVWSDAFVGEDSLTQAISMIRRALGDDPRDPTYIQTIPKRGYRFIAEVAALPIPGTQTSADDGETIETDLPGAGAVIGVGTSLRNFKILDELGAGAMGIVYRARDTALEREVAVKVLPPDFSSEPERIARLEREAKLIAAVSHPNIAAIYSLEEVNGMRFPVLELVEGETLEQRLRNGPIAMRDALGIAGQIASALEAAHNRGIIHRDLKPANIKVAPDQQVKVLDFGLAKGLEVEVFGTSSADSPTESMTIMGSRRGSIVGTAAYMSPEQARGQAADERSDIWSFGCVLYEMLTGRRPFEGDTVSETIAGVLEREPNWEALPPDAPPSTNKLLRRCLSKDPDLRLHHIADARIELADSKNEMKAGTGEPEGTSVGVGDGESRRSIGRRVFGVIVSIVAVLALAFGLNIGGLRDRVRGMGSPDERLSIDSLAVLPFENISGDPAQDYIADGLTYELIAELGRVTNVTAPSSVMLFKDDRPSLPDIARVLNVDGVLETSVWASGDKVRITAQLFHGETQTSIWSNRYEEDTADVFTLLGNLTREISSEIEVALSGEQAARLARTRPVEPEALDAYLRGRQLVTRRSVEDASEALELFRAAADIEPSFAEAYAGQAAAYSTLSQSLLAGFTPAEGYPLLRAAATRALELDNSLAEPHAALGFVATFYDWEWTTAEVEFRRAIDLNPSFARAHMLYSFFLITQLRFDEAEDEINRAYELDPLDAQINLNRVGPLIHTGRYEEAIRIEREVLDLYPDFALAHYVLGADLLEAGLNAEAIAELEAASSLSIEYLGVLGYAYARTGREDDARDVLEQLAEMAEHSYVSSEEIARIHAWLGDKDEAFLWLERAFEERTAYLPYMRSDPWWQPLRTDPRFDELVARLGFPPD